MKSKSLIIVVVIALLLNGCSKDSSDSNSQKPFGLEDVDYNKFVLKTKEQVVGQFLGHDIHWLFENWETSFGYHHGSYHCLMDDQTIQNRFFSLYDNAKRGKIASVTVRSPAFSTDSSYVFKSGIFAVGKKSLSDKNSTIYEGFEIEGVTTDGQCFSTKGPQSKGHFEIVKVQPFTSSAPGVLVKNLKIWVVFTGSLYGCDDKKIGEIRNGTAIGAVHIETIYGNGE